MTKTITKTVGCDIGDKYCQLCVLEGAEVIERARVRTSQAGLRKWFAGRATAVVAIEVGTHSRWIAQLLTELGHQVLVANARQVRLIYASKKKNDKVDAESLARLARLDRKLLSPIQHRGRKAHAQLAVLRSRDTLVSVRSSLVAHARGVAKSMGLRIPKCETSAFARRARPLLSAELAVALEPVLGSIEQLSAQIGAIDKRLEQMLDTEPDAKRLTQIHGVGALTAMAFVLTLEDPSRFERSRDLGPFLGLVPRQSQSGDTDPDLRITKAGDPFVRRLLVQCAHYILGVYGHDSELRRFGMRLLARGGKRAKKKAVIAVARKLAVLMHHLWVSGQLYQPLRQPTPQAA